MNNTGKSNALGYLTVFGTGVEYIGNIPLVGITFVFDSVVKTVSTLKVLDQDNLLVSHDVKYCSFISNNHRYFGKVVQISGEDGETSIDVLLHYNVLDKPIFINSGNYTDIETTLVNILQSEYINNDVKDDLPLVFDKVTTTSGYIDSPNGLIDWSELVGQLIRVHGIYITVTYDGENVLVKLERKTLSNITRYSKELIDIQFNFDESQTTKLVYKAINGTIYKYYLLKDGSITTNPNHSNRVDFVVEKKELLDVSVTVSDVLPKAKSELEKTYANEITIVYDLDKETVKDIFNLLNQPVTLVLDNQNTLDTAITKITKTTNTSWVTLTLGTGRQRLTDKLKRLMR